ncbi:MAG: hypothetical protein GKR98_10440 [Boseongicola sp.]|nr:MAG: hypothetical protein GKR98_10440 [Boseongicola sp.]
MTDNEDETAPSAEVTLLLGPQTRLALCLNDLVRRRRKEFSAHGFSGFQNRLASRTLRAAAADASTPLEVKRNQLAGAFGFSANSKTVLSAINLLGTPSSVVQNGMLYPGSDVKLAQVAPLFEDVRLRLVLSIEPLDELLYFLPADAWSSRVSQTPWEVLYELSWADLISDIQDAFPDREILVMSPEAAVLGTNEVLHTLFPDMDLKDEVPGLRLPYLTERGQEVLRNDLATAEAIDAVFEAHRLRPTSLELKTKTNIDDLTSTLLRQRFLDDLAGIEKLSNVTLI